MAPNQKGTLIIDQSCKDYTGINGFAYFLYGMVDLHQWIKRDDLIHGRLQHNKELVAKSLEAKNQMMKYTTAGKNA